MSSKYHYEERSDTLFVHIKDEEEDTFEELIPGINIELDKKNNILGIEILNASRFYRALATKRTSSRTHKRSASITHAA